MSKSPIHELLVEDANNMEDALTRISDDDGIWQNKIIKAICRAVYNLLQLALRRVPRQASKAVRVGEFEKVSALQFLQDSAYLTDSTPDAIRSRSKLVHAYDHVILPTRSTSGSAGYDIHSPFAFTLAPGQTFKIPSGLRVRLEDGWWLGCLPRSSIGFKYRVSLDNTMGVIDSDYYFADNEGHIFIKLTNNGDKELVVKEGDRLVQAIFIPYGITYSDNAKSSRSGGVGSTGA